MTVYDLYSHQTLAESGRVKGGHVRIFMAIRNHSKKQELIIDSLLLNVPNTMSILGAPSACYFVLPKTQTY